jgi:hypothetical protein
MLQVDDHEVERVREFRYLGSTLTEGYKNAIEIKYVENCNGKSSYGLKKQLSSRYLGRQTKCALYKMLVWPVVTRGNES